MNDQEETGGEQAGLTVRTGRFGDDKDPNLGAEFRFKPGQSGNPAGRKKGQSLSTTIQDMLDDEKFIERLSKGVRDKVLEADPDFQGTPMRAMITAALLEAINVNGHPSSKQAAREWLAKYGYGTKVDVTSKGERISDTPKIISVIQPRGGDEPAPTEA
jgi:hypothetical protein